MGADQKIIGLQSGRCQTGIHRSSRFFRFIQLNALCFVFNESLWSFILMKILAFVLILLFIIFAFFEKNDVVKFLFNWIFNYVFSRDVFSTV